MQHRVVIVTSWSIRRNVIMSAGHWVSVSLSVRIRGRAINCNKVCPSPFYGDRRVKSCRAQYRPINVRRIACWRWIGDVYRSTIYIDHIISRIYQFRIYNDHINDRSAEYTRTVDSYFYNVATKVSLNSFEIIGFVESCRDDCQIRSFSTVS